MINIIMIKLCYFCGVLKKMECFRKCIYTYKKKPKSKIYYRNKCKKCNTLHRRNYLKKYYISLSLRKKYKIFKPVDKDKPFDKIITIFIEI